MRPTVNYSEAFIKNQAALSAYIAHESIIVTLCVGLERLLKTT
jgi:hypothetical protein